MGSGLWPQRKWAMCCPSLSWESDPQVPLCQLFWGIFPGRRASFTLSFRWPGLFLSIPCWMTLRALASFYIFSLCSFRSWMLSFYPSAPEEAPKFTFPTVLSVKYGFTSVSCVEERVGIVENGCTLGPKSYPSSLRLNLRLAGPGIHRQTGVALSNTGSDTCVQYALPDQGHEGVAPDPTWHTTSAELESHQPRLLVGRGRHHSATKHSQLGVHTGSIVWTVLGHRLRRLCSVPQEISPTSSFWASFKREPVYRIFSRI